MCILLSLKNNKEFQDCFVSMHDYLEIKFNGSKICMMHYPIAEWHDCHHGSLMLHGHLHGNNSGLRKYRVRDVALDATGRVVSSMDDMIRDALKGEIRSHHH